MTTPEHADEGALELDTRSLYLTDNLPMIYLSPGASMPTEIADMLVPFSLMFGLPAFDSVAAIEHGFGELLHAPEGWQLRFEYDDLDPFPLLAIDWPAMPAPLLQGVRKATPPQWTVDTILVGQAVLMIGPRLDWEAMMITLDDSSIVPNESILRAIGGRPTAAGIAPAIVPTIVVP